MSKRARDDELTKSLVLDIRDTEKEIKQIRVVIKFKEKQLKQYKANKARDLKELAKLL